MDQSLAIVEASTDWYANTEAPPLKGKEPHDFCSFNEHRHACIRADFVDGDRELWA